MKIKISLIASLLAMTLSGTTDAAAPTADETISALSSRLAGQWIGINTTLADGYVDVVSIDGTYYRIYAPAVKLLTDLCDTSSKPPFGSNGVVYCLAK
jgi:hypothetical protein